jgi:transcriptional regulator with XRE-family HTH domain
MFTIKSKTARAFYFCTDADNMNWAQAIRVGLAINNQTNQWLADELSVSKQYVSSMCNGSKTPSVQMIESLSMAFDAKMSEFAHWGEL